MAETRIIEHPDQLQGETVHDQEGQSIGSVKTVYGLGEDAVPMWFTIELSQGIAASRLVFLPLARLKQQGESLTVPYSVAHLLESPELEEGEEVSAEADRELRNFYAIDLADGEQRTDNISYAAQVPDGDGPARRVQEG